MKFEHMILYNVELNMILYMILHNVELNYYK